VDRQPPTRVDWTKDCPEYPMAFIRLAAAQRRLERIIVANRTDVTSELLGAKDTPPATPRGTTSAGSALNGVTAVEGGAEERVKSLAATASHSPSPTNPPITPIGPPRGKLIVEIIEARDLVPSKYPYVVCTFESNEFISQGPRRSFDAAEGHGGDRSPRNSSGNGKPPSPSGVGRSIAIPMTSRQSSSTSLSEMQGQKCGPTSGAGSTNPKWEHNAVL